MRWHVQVMGQGPALLLLHGTGASTHSWRDVMPKLADRIHGDGARSARPRLHANPPAKRSLSLPGMASGGRRCCFAELEPHRRARGVGHSAGAAVLVRMAVERLFAPDDIVSFNGAFFPVSGVAGQFFSPLAKAVAGATLHARRCLPRMADRKAVERLLRDTGSMIDAGGLDLYQRLFSNEGHVAGTLRHDGGLGPALGADRICATCTCRLYLVRALKRPHHLARRQRPGRKARARRASVIDIAGPRPPGPRGGSRPGGRHHRRPGQATCLR